MDNLEQLIKASMFCSNFTLDNIIVTTKEKLDLSSIKYSKVKNFYLNVVYSDAIENTYECLTEVLTEIDNCKPLLSSCKLLSIRCSCSNQSAIMIEIKRRELTRIQAIIDFAEDE